MYEIVSIKQKRDGLKENWMFGTKSCVVKGIALEPNSRAIVGS